MISKLTELNILSRLKSETRESHDAIEQNEAMKKIMQTDLTVSHYRQVLKKKYGYYKVVEAKLRTILQNTSLDYNNREKISLLHDDLLGMGVSEQEIDNLSLCDGVPSIANLAEALGVLYVLEGSTLGGQVIARHLLKTLPTDTHTNIRFFSGYGKEKIGYMWQHFQTFVLNYTHENPSQEQIILNTAKQTFDTLDRWMAN